MSHSNKFKQHGKRSYDGKREPHDAINLFKEVQEKILFLRNQEVILDADVAQLYGVETREVNQAVRNNPNKFPKGMYLRLIGKNLQSCDQNFDRK